LSGTAVNHLKRFMLGYQFSTKESESWWSPLRCASWRGRHGDVCTKPCLLSVHMTFATKHQMLLTRSPTVTLRLSRSIQVGGITVRSPRSEYALAHFPRRYHYLTSLPLLNTTSWSFQTRSHYTLVSKKCIKLVRMPRLEVFRSVGYMVFQTEGVHTRIRVWRVWVWCCVVERFPIRQWVCEPLEICSL
jgi:hypothetical protein